MKQRTKTRFGVYVPAPALGPKKQIDIDAFYDKGGMNYFNCKNEPRGYYAGFNTVDVEVRDGFTSVSFMMFASGGVKFLLEPAIRLNAKRLAYWADVVGAKAPEVAALLNSGDRAGAIDMMKSVSLVYGATAPVAPPATVTANA